MDSPGEGRRPLSARGLVLVETFCAATGLTEAQVEALVSDGVTEGAFYPHGALVGLFDDVLPSAADLAARGLTARSGYNPEALRTYEEDPLEGPDPDPGAGASWTMGWD